MALIDKVRDLLNALSLDDPATAWEKAELRQHRERHRPLGTEEEYLFEKGGPPPKSLRERALGSLAKARRAVSSLLPNRASPAAPSSPTETRTEAPRISERAAPSAGAPHRPETAPTPPTEPRAEAPRTHERRGFGALDALQGLLGVPQTERLREQQRAKLEQSRKRIGRLAEEQDTLKGKKASLEGRVNKTRGRVEEIRHAKRRVAEAKAGVGKADTEANRRFEKLKEFGEKKRRLFGGVTAVPAWVHEEERQHTNSWRRALAQKQNALHELSRAKQQVKDLPKEKSEQAKLTQQEERLNRATSRLADINERLDKTMHQKMEEEEHLHGIGKVGMKELGESLHKAGAGFLKIGSSIVTQQSGARAAAHAWEGAFDVAGAVASVIPEIGPALSKMISILGKFNPPALTAMMTEFADKQLEHNFQMAGQFSPHMTLVQAHNFMHQMAEDVTQGAMLAPSALELSEARAYRRRATRVFDTTWEEMKNKTGSWWNKVMGDAAQDTELSIRRRFDRGEITADQMQSKIKAASMDQAFGLNVLNNTKWWQWALFFPFGPIAPYVGGVYETSKKTEEERKKDEKDVAALRAKDPATIEKFTLGNMDRYYQSLHKDNNDVTTVGEEMTMAGRAYMAARRGDKTFGWNGKAENVEDWAAVRGRPMRFGI